MEKRFVDLKEKYEKAVKRLDRKSMWIGNFRLVLVVGIIYGVFMNIKTYSSDYHMVLFPSLLGFIILVIWHTNVKEDLNHSNTLIEINNRYLKRLNGEWVEFEDIGEEFMDAEHPYATDLDVVGKYSLFQLLNLSNTETGRALFAKSLLYPEKDVKKILDRQEASKELKDEIEFVQSVECVTSKNRKNLRNTDKLIEYAESDMVAFKQPLLKWLIRLFPIVMIGLNISMFFSKVFVIPAIAATIIQTAIWILGIIKNARILEMVQFLRYNLETYTHVLKIIEPKEFKCAELLRLKELMFGDKSSLNAIAELGKITSLISFRSSGILYVILNLLFLWDYQCVFIMETWRDKYGKQVEDWIEGIGELEVLISYSQIENLIDDCNYPSIIEGENRVIAKKLGHPLINNDVRVCNDLEIKDEIFIITGSNMSGKTTFLRTIGINLILAYNGAPVCAESFEANVLDIYSSMRIVDDLSQGISTFYAEILKIKKIIDHSEKVKNMIFLIDEIFRGTNSADRITGARNVISNLSQNGVIGAVSTHDLELCALADEREKIENWHFADKYNNDEIIFDFKLKKGKSTSTNAKNLMRLAGIKMIEE